MFYIHHVCSKNSALHGYTLVLPFETFEEAKNNARSAGAELGIKYTLKALSGDYLAMGASTRIANSLDAFTSNCNSAPCSLALEDGIVYEIKEDELPDHDYLLFVEVKKDDSWRFSEETPGYTGPVDRV